MKINTNYIGEVEYTEEEVINMTIGLYGFPESKTYILIGEMTVEFPFMWFQSTTENDISFILTDPFLFVDNYNFEIDDDIVEKLEIKAVEDVKVFTTVIIKEEIGESTINLKSPIIINQANKMAEQVVIDADYPYKYKIFSKKAVI